jgi:hypothetical protein
VLGERCKRPRTAATRHARRGGVLALLVVATFAGLVACDARNRSRAVTVTTLENASPVRPTMKRRAIVSDAARLREFAFPLGRRISLIQIRNSREWESLRRHAPELGPPPDFQRGAVFGLASSAGVPLEGTWPIRLEAVRVHEGAGFAVGSFNGGSYLPDGTTYLETAQVEGLNSVLMVEVNGTRFYPQ